LDFEVGGMESGVFRPEINQTTTITTSGTLQAVWGLSDTQVADTSATAATSILLSTASEGNLNNLPPIQLNTYTAPEHPPTLPQVTAGVVFQIPEPEVPKAKKTSFSFLSDDIAEIRDQINAISRDFLGDRLLELPQERAILDVYKPAESPEEFRSRVQSLAGICTAMNKQIMGKYLNKDSTKDVGSILLLEELLGKLVDSDQVAEVCNVLKNVNELRKGYPAHGDNTDKFLPAHDYFSITYPITNFESAWERILGAYFNAMKSLTKILAENRNKNNPK
jgi:hypothetical protein